VLLGAKKNFFNIITFFTLVLMKPDFRYEILHTEPWFNIIQDISQLISKKKFEILSSTCCKSSLSDFSWATSALMHPFIEHSVAYKIRYGTEYHQ
jgi:hypothetical protein